MSRWEYLIVRWTYSTQEQDGKRTWRHEYFVSRPGAGFQANAAAAGLVLLVITLLMNAGAIYFRYRLRKRITW